MSYNAKTKPRFKTGDKLQHFLGQWGEYDLYFDSGCCIARNGDEPHEYLATGWGLKAQTLNPMEHERRNPSPTTEAFLRAAESGLLPEEYTITREPYISATPWKVHG
jgi:hypothetical protein